MIRRVLSWFLKRPEIKVSTGVEVYRLPRTALIWILASLTAVTLPHVGRMPVWLTVLCVCCVGISILIFQGRMSHPGSKIKTSIVFLVLFAIIAQYGRDIFSTDAIVGVLVVGISMKLLEMKKRRDVLMVIYLCYFTVLSEFIYSQSIVIALYMAFVILIITSALMSITQTEEFQRPMRTLKLSGVVLLQSIPLMAILFLLFPRISPLWSVPLQSTNGITGLSDEMAPGDIGDLTRSGDVAFRVEFGGSIPAYNQLYWRGITLDRFDGRQWSRNRPRVNPQSLNPRALNSEINVALWYQNIQLLGSSVPYNVIMEATQQNWIYTLMVPQISNDRLWMRREFQVGTARPITQRFSYDAESYLDHVVDETLGDRDRRRNTSLPDEGNLQSRAFARQLYEESASDTEFVNAILQYIRDNEFFYTLSPSLLGVDTIYDFLFNTREGFCEHYASAFTYLMREVGIPARVVLGYQGGEFNKYNGTLIVRQYDAHAWTEVWLEDQGWVRIDPTAAVAPDRVEFGSQFTLQEDENFLDDELFSMLKYRSSSLLLNDLILRLEMIDYAWNRFVLNYDVGMQFSLFSRIFDSVNQKKIVMSLLALIFLFTGGVAILVLRKPTRKELAPVNALYLKFCKFLSDNGINRQPGETPMSYCARITAIQPQWSQDVAAITGLYMDIAFAPNTKQEADAKTRALKQAIRKFKIIN